MKWFNWYWYKYLLESDGWYNMWCRIKGHPSGVWFHNVNTLEPDMKCKDCGEDLG